jgi:hypothetical protein
MPNKSPAVTDTIKKARKGLSLPHVIIRTRPAMHKKMMRKVKSNFS